MIPEYLLKIITIIMRISKHEADQFIQFSQREIETLFRQRRSEIENYKNRNLNHRSDDSNFYISNVLLIFIMITIVTLISVVIIRAYIFGKKVFFY